MLAEKAGDCLERGEASEALEAVAKAALLERRDPVIGRIYLAAAERCRDRTSQVRALEYLTQTFPTDARFFGQLGYLYLLTDERERAREAAARARAVLPARMKDRKHWLTLIEYVEAQADAVTAGPTREPLALSRDRDGAAGRRPARGARSSRAPGERDADRTFAPGLPSSDGRGSLLRLDRAAETADGHPEPHVSPPASRLHDAAHEPALAVPARFEIAVEMAAEIDGLEVLASPSFGSRESVELAGLAARIRDAESYDRLFAIERACGLLRFSHQEETARKVLSSFLGRALLADEVGLGKTVEAGLILSEYLLRGRVQRALVLAPPSLVGQWREELASKFDIVARTTEDPAFRTDSDRFWSDNGVAIASLATARSVRQRESVVSRPWDLVIVDEAHALKNAATESYRLVSRITSRFLLLVTATPVENRIEELYNLVSLIRPGQLGQRRVFLRRFSDSRLSKSEATRAEVRALLGEVMVRNTRALSGVRLPPRFARTVLVPPEPAEAELYEHLAAALRALGPGGRTGPLLSILLQEAGSSPFAVRATLAKLAADPGRASQVARALSPAIQVAERPVVTGKAAALLRVLGDGAGDPAVVFTRFRATLDFLAGALTNAGIAHEKLDGNVPAPLRHEAIGRVRERGGVLLSTEVAAEGLNLQFCTRIVNFDLPWNPMRIEQRIGRVHRIGQDHAVDVVNLCLAGSIEERILTILDDRINLFELVVGEAEMILGYLDDEREFPELVLDAFADPDPAGRDREFARIADALAAARARYDNVKRFDEGFFRDELGV